MDKRNKIFFKLILCSIFVITLLSFFYTPKIYALGDVFSDGKAFLEKGENVYDKISKKQLEQTSDTIYNTLLAIGIVIAVIVAMILGIQFIVATADEKAKVKEAMIPFVIGCIVVFGAFTIWKTIVTIGNKAEKDIASIVILDNTIKKV